MTNLLEIKGEIIYQHPNHDHVEIVWRAIEVELSSMKKKKVQMEGETKNNKILIRINTNKISKFRAFSLSFIRYLGLASTLLEQK